MSDERTSGDVIRRYALGALSGAELEEAEARLLTDDDFADELEAIETELADEYVAGELTASEQAQFAERLRRSATLRNRVATAENLADAAARRRPPARSTAFAGWLLAAAAGAAIIAGGLWMARSAPVVPPPAAANTPAQVPTPPAVTPPSQRPALVATIALFGAVVRDESAVPAFVVRDVSGPVRIELHLDAADAYASYDVSIETGGGQQVAAQRAMTATRDGGGLVVAMEVPAEQLPPGRYAARISGRSASTATLIAVYPFRSTR